MSQPKKGSSRFKRYEKPVVEERFDFAELVRRQIERCLIAASDLEGEFPSAVQALEVLIPEDLKDETYKNEFEMATIIREKLEFENFSGIRLGRPDRPLMRYRVDSPLKRYDIPYKLDEDDKQVIDWSDPNIISPKFVEEPYVNWHFRFNAAFNMFTRMGVAVRRINRG